MRMRTASIFPTAIVWLLLAGLGATPAHGASIDQLAWLAGCWESAAGPRQSEEQWMRPRGGVMVGMSRTVASDTTREIEHLLIREVGGKLAYIASPSGQARTTFEAIQVTDSLVVFENPTHDFPQRIRYRRLPDGSLMARIEGTVGGQTKGVNYPMKRATCP